MKKFFIPLMFVLVLPATFSCGTLQRAGYSLNERDAAAAIRQMLEIGARESVNGSFNKDAMMAAIFPESVRKVLNTLQQLGLTNEINRFTTTLGTASEKAAANSIPIFVDGIYKMNFTDAMRIIKNGGTAATDYLRGSVGDSLRRSITPVMQAAIDEYKLNEQWAKIISPLKSIAGNKLNLDLPNLMAGIVSEAMFRKIEEKEKQIRTEASARTTILLQNVFSRSWS